MTRLILQLPDPTVVAGRAFARTAPDGSIDGVDDRGIYANDLRLLRRVEAYRAHRDTPVAGRIALGEDGCAVRFEIPAVEPGTGVLLVVEVDGTDIITVQELLAEEDGAWSRAFSGIGSVRPDARVRLDVRCEGADIDDRDGVALADGAVAADGTARTASWRWRVPATLPGPINVTIEVRASWALTSEQQPAVPMPYAARNRDGDHARSTWRTECSQPNGSSFAPLVRAGLDELARLRLRTEDGHVLAGGAPWDLTVVGCDALLAAWMALPVDPSLAESTLRYLARHQATAYDLAIDAEPGKIQRDERTGIAALRWHPRYFGSVDSTPLFLMLLSEATRWSGDTALARELEAPARRAVDWIQSRIDEDSLGLVGFWRRSERGLDVQSWKDTPDSQRDHRGRIATGLIRAIETQGYAVAALRGAARLAASAWNDEVIASEWAGSARLLERRVLDRFSVELPPSRLFREDDPRLEGLLAQGVDADGMALDAMCSNPGHLLWTEALADPLQRTRLIEQLASPALSNGWGIRTMSTFDAGYDPTSPHRGAVWPHDTAICISGILNYDRERGTALAHDLFAGAIATGGRFPAAWSGVARTETPRPEVLHGFAGPRACSAASPFLVLRAILGLDPDPTGHRLDATSAELPAWLHGFRWDGVPALGTRWDIVVGSDGAATVQESV